MPYGMSFDVKTIISQEEWNGIYNDACAQAFVTLALARRDAEMAYDDITSWGTEDERRGAFGEFKTAITAALHAYDVALIWALKARDQAGRKA